jgi:mono/diheme cytochrome c family protein
VTHGWLKASSAEEKIAISWARNDAASANIFPTGLWENAPSGYRWTARPTLVPHVYLVDLRTRDGSGWTWKVDVEYNDIKRVAGSFPPPTAAADAALPISPGRLPRLQVAHGNAAAGSQVFNANCASCHGEGGRGAQVGPNLAGTSLTAGQVAYMVRSPQGVDRDSAMPRLPLTEQQVADVATYVASLK